MQFTQERNKWYSWNTLAGAYISELRSQLLPASRIPEQGKETTLQLFILTVLEVF